MTLKGVHPHHKLHGFFFECPGCGIDIADETHVHADNCPARSDRPKADQSVSPRQALITLLKNRMHVDYGHDLPEQDFADEADLILQRLEDAGLAVMPIVQTHPPGRQITLAHDMIIGGIRYDAGTYRVQRVDEEQKEPLF